MSFSRVILSVTPSFWVLELSLLTPEQTRSYLPQDGYDQELTSFYRTGQVLKRHFGPVKQFV